MQTVMCTVPSNKPVHRMHGYKINGSFCIETRLLWFLIKMAADKEVFVFDFV